MIMIVIMSFYPIQIQFMFMSFKVFYEISLIMIMSVIQYEISWLRIMIMSLNPVLDQFFK